VADRMFRQATEADPSMCDAWLARVIAGDDSVVVLAGAWQCRESMGWETRRLSVLPGQFNPLVYDGMFARLEITSEASLGAAYAVALARDGRYRDADVLLDQIHSTDPFDADLYAYAHGLVHFRAQRWPDVLADFPAGKRWRKPVYGAAAAAMATTALASLGVFEDAFRRAQLAIDGDLCPQAATIALYTQAMCLRHLNKEDDAMQLLPFPLPLQFLRVFLLARLDFIGLRGGHVVRQVYVHSYEIKHSVLDQVLSVSVQCLSRR